MVSDQSQPDVASNRLRKAVDEYGVVAVAVSGRRVPGLAIRGQTSTGYGVTRGGESALMAMLSSCAPGLVVTNIENGYGAACAALVPARSRGDSHS